MKTTTRIYAGLTLLLCVICIVPLAAGGLIGGQDSSNLTISAKTDRGYYAPGEVIRVRGFITGEMEKPVVAELLFQFQEMNKTATCGSDGIFRINVPISLALPESLYRLSISAHADGYLEKNLSVPIIIMGEPSSLAPAPVIPDEFLTT